MLAAPLLVLGIPGLVASVDLFLPVLGGFARRVGAEAAIGRAPAVSRLGNLVLEAPVPLVVVRHAGAMYRRELAGFRRDPCRSRSARRTARRPRSSRPAARTTRTRW